LYERIKESASAGVNIMFIYGKKELSKEQDLLLKSLSNVQIYFLENLHAKCYLNEQAGIISSMNLHDFSERNNREMGISFSKEGSKDVYHNVMSEVNSIRLAAESISTPAVTRKPAVPPITGTIFSYMDGLMDQLISNYPSFSFIINRYDDSLECAEFGEFFRLDILPKDTYLRIDFRLRGKSIGEDFKLLYSNQYEIIKHFPKDVVNWGNQMRRIKLDFPLERAKLPAIESNYFLNWIKTSKELFESILMKRRAGEAP
jgi:hypothetical protein